MADLFTPFNRLGSEATGVEGTGLGLALSKRLVELMGGTLGVDTQPDRGSRFWVELPVAEHPTERAERTAGAISEQPLRNGAARTVLYIEDNLSNLQLVQAILTRRPGVKLLAAMQGGLGLELARQHHPDLVLLDLHLPDIPGDEVLARLRAEPRTHRTPIVIISADATPRQVERLLASGADDYLTKPLDVTVFLEVVDAQLDFEENGD